MNKLNIDSTYGVVVIQNYKAVSVDKNYARIFGYNSPQELMDSIDSFLDLIEPSMHEAAMDNYKDIISGRVVPRGHTFRNVDRYGRSFIIFAIDHLIEWQGAPALQVTVIDLSMVEHANEQIKELNLQFKRMITDSRQGILVHKNFKPLFVNRAWVKLMRAESIEFVLARGDVLDRVLPENRQTAINRNNAQLGGRRVEYDNNVYQNVCYDGTKRYFNVYDNLIEWDGEPALQVILEDVTEHVELRKKLEYRASHDSLTDLYNRSAIYDKLKASCSNAESLVCLLIDIDNFKSINDTHGHHDGDEVIRTLASILKEKVGELGIIGRWGGEEFIVFLQSSNFEQAKRVAENLRQTFNNTVFDLSKGQLVSSVSIGIAISGCKCASQKGIDGLVKDADRNMYLAKSNGKNQISWD
ncbi:sensor domain-containing diguanylate cyclase [Vibrio sp. DW001]|uniref:sensor domain-containing diguanylate cyclase n=1 Tax=Vibrio sp. DW001 TaxID=2912315 RepID=UPI0023AE91C7|nr:sensor domain-containing diguanylate cyclase [Vibrio sp. DW001]WED28197.1 sensor domain-containing diguanylate cyclase [Vibrio sp. DW001]